jgi:hypothetical protein
MSSMMAPVILSFADSFKIENLKEVIASAKNYLSLAHSPNEKIASQRK